MGGKKALKSILIVIGVAVVSIVSVIVIISNIGKNKEETKWVAIEPASVYDDDISTETRVCNTSEPVLLVRSSKPASGSLKYSLKKTTEETDNDIPEMTAGQDFGVSEETFFGNAEMLSDYDANTVEYVIIYTVNADELVEWAFRAYNEEWGYTTGGCEEFFVDCSGLIKSCVGVCARGTEELLAEAPERGEISTMPDIPGLGVYYEGHVGIYVGNGKVIDARNEASGVGYDAVDYEAWTDWFEIKGVDYSRYTNNGCE
ncbi:MAG: C40 family peptidase [Lachnospiraceae bacterium]|nr:C40 family peptidase [Lachnospiraceae bacterium]